MSDAYDRADDPGHGPAGEDGDGGRLGEEVDEAMAPVAEQRCGWIGSIARCTPPSSHDAAERSELTTVESIEDVLRWRLRPRRVSRRVVGTSPRAVSVRRARRPGLAPASMTGWRVGYACAPEPVAALMHRIHQYTMLCAPSMSQVAAVEALRGAQNEVEEMVGDYDRRRRLFVKGLNEIGLECPEPGGAFYAFPSIRSTGLTSQEFAEQLLAEEKVAVVPGDVFGPSGDGHVRCSYATALPQLEVALEKMGRFCAARR